MNDKNNSGQLVDREVFSMEPTTFAELERWAKMISESDLAPKDYKGKPGNVIIAIQMGRELGIKGLQALQNIAVINGRPSLWGDLIPALVLGSGLCEEFDETFDERTWTYTCLMRRKGHTKPFVRSFSKADAEKARLWTKDGTWQQYPKRMLQLRARGFCARDAFPDVLKGCRIAEEELDYIEGEFTAEPATIKPPKALSAPPVAEKTEAAAVAQPAAPDQLAAQAAAVQEGLAGDAKNDKPEEPRPETPTPAGFKRIAVALDAKCTAKSCGQAFSDGFAYYDAKKGVFHADCVPVS